MNRITCSVMFTFISMSCFAQMGFEMKVGYSTYSMRDLSKFQRLQTTSPVPVKVTNDFPGNLTGGVSLYYSIHKNVETGVDYTYNNTIGRVHYRDYSGEIGIDQKAIAHAFGAFTRLTFFEKGDFKLKGTAMLSLWRSQINFDQYLRMGTNNEQTQFAVVSNNVGITGAIEPVYRLNDQTYIGARIGGMLEIPGPLHLKGEPRATLQYDNGTVISAHWSGFRSEIYIGFTMPTYSDY